MKIEVYSVYDKAAKAFLQPFFSNARGLALRSFMDAVADEKHQFARHAEDYTLFCIGQFHDETGELLPCMPEKVITALECFPDRVQRHKVSDVGA